MLRRIYVAFQDRNWTARPWRILEEDIDAGSTSFRIRLRAQGTFDAHAFTWHAHLTGDEQGVIAYQFHGTTTEPFLRNRLGLCILHPTAETAGMPAILERIDGSIQPSAFPDAISPHQPFLQMRALTHEVLPGVHATVRMEGDTFESEDHRNWSDASFKHYCTPISLPFPVTVQPGEVIEQSVTLTLQGDVPAVEPLPDDPVQITVEAGLVPMPQIGIQLDADGHLLSDIEIERLRALRLGHVRVDLMPAEGPERLETALAEATALGCRLVPAINGTAADTERFAAFADDPRIQHWLIFDPATKVTDPALAEEATSVLGPRVGGGTNLYFTELNRGRPAGPDIIAFSVNPQVHATDDHSVMQNAMTLAAIARNARALYPGAWLEISPITLRPRLNPNATEPAVDHSNTPLPAHVDARQCQPIAAAWTILSLKTIAETGCIDAVTYYRATGWEGLMERSAGSPQPADFPSRPGRPYPVYDVLRAVAGARHAVPCTSSRPDLIECLVLDSGTALIASRSYEPHRAVIGSQSAIVPPYGFAIVALPGTPTEPRDGDAR